MSKIKAILVKAFTTDPAAGNPAGVILDADGLSDEQMLHIAAKLGFSESAFVSASGKADFRVRFFSPTTEVNFCGHATIATFYALMGASKISAGKSNEVTVTQETNVGILPVTCHSDGRIVMTQNAPTFGPIEHDRTRIAALLGISELAILNYPIQVVSTGTPKLMIHVDSLDTLSSITPDLAGITAYCRAGEARGFYPFTSQTIETSANFHARQFNPAAGIDEDPITGIAGGALGCYAQRYGLVSGDELVVEQGYGMGNGGQMFVSLSDGVRVGGYAIEFGQQDVS